MTSWDEMTIQKLDPGTENVPYVAGMNVTACPTMTFDVCNQLSKVTTINSTGTASANLGTEQFLFLAWVPSATAFYGPGNLPPGPGGAQYYSTTTKLGGFMAVQFSP